MMLVRSFDAAAPRAGDTPQGMTGEHIGGLPFTLAYDRTPTRGRVDVSASGRHHELLLVFSGSGVLTPRTGAPHPLARGTALHVDGRVGYRIEAARETPLDYVRLRWPRERSGGSRPLVRRTLDPAAMRFSYGMRLQHLSDATDIPEQPFGSVFGEVLPRTTSKIHSHQDGEIFLVLEGSADILIEDESQRLTSGDLVFLPPFHMHGIRNDTDETFRLVSVYWEDADSAATRLAARDPRVCAPGTCVVFCPPPTPNGGLHIGHLAGPYLRADMYVRALRTLGREAGLCTGTDDHQSYVATAARSAGTSPEKLAQSTGDQIAATLRAADVRVDHLYRPLGEPGHEATMKARFAALAASPAVREAVVQSPWCSPCGHPLHQGFARGSCPSCHDACDGEICESCGRPNNARELAGLVCALCGSPPESREEATHLLDLNRHRGQLLRYLEHVEGGGRLRGLAAQLLDESPHPYRLTRGGTWGIPVIEDAASPGLLDPWVELALVQLEQTERFVQEHGPTTPVTFLGYDNSFYYAILMPAVAFATGRADLLPRAFVTNEFLHLDGAKFSTSRGHAVWADDVLAHTPADTLRLALLRRAPEDEIADLGTEAIAGMSADPLLRDLRRWIAGFADLVGAGTVPGTGAWSAAHREFYRFLNLTTRQLDRLLVADAFSSVAYVHELDSLVREALRFRTAEAYKRTLPDKAEEARTSVALEYLAAKAFAALAFPAMPSLCSALWNGLGLHGEPVRENVWSFIVPGTHTRPEKLEELAAGGTRP